MPGTRLMDIKLFIGWPITIEKYSSLFFQEVLETPHVNNSGTYGNQYACKDGERNELDERTEAAEETRNGIANTLTDEFLVLIVLRFRDIVGNDRGQQGVNGAKAGKGESGGNGRLER